jgi:cobalt-zinc-cadmium efflux system outer membrane protein
VNEAIDDTVCHLAAQPRDLQPTLPADEPLLPAPLPVPKSEGQESRLSLRERTPNRSAKGDVAGTPLTVPPDLLPGGPVPPLDVTGTEAEKARKLKVLFPPLPPLGDEPPLALGEEGRPLNLADLHRLAQANNPQLKQAIAQREAASGAALQAGLPPNPTIGYAGDTAGTVGGAGYQGGFIEQTIKTGNKLQLARAIAAMDLANAELAVKRAQSDLTTRIRSDYFAVLVARESVRRHRALVKFTNDVYDLQLAQGLRGFAAPYEPMYLRSLATQARGGLVQARNRAVAAWKQLAADMGLPGLPATELAGRIDAPVPLFDHQQVLSYILEHHTDLRTADNTLTQANLHLQLARLTPVPDFSLKFILQKDRTGPPFELAHTLQLSMPLPVWDCNQGGIAQAQANVVRASEEAHRVRVALSGTLAEAFERYENNRVLLGYYRDQILPDLVRVYTNLYRRYQVGGDGAPGFADVVVAQQNLAAAVATYVTTLGAVWQAVVEVADPLQSADLFGVQGPLMPVATIPDLENLPPLPCCHPCSPLPGLHQSVAERIWPLADPSPIKGSRILP